MWLRSGHIIEGPKSDYCMTMNTVLASSNVHSGLAYPHPNLTKIIGKPTPVTLKLFTKEVYANTRAIPCHHNGKRYGHLGLVMSDAEYAALRNATAFPALTDPGDVPAVANGADGVAITNQMKTYEQTLFRYQTRIQVENDLKQMIIGAVEPIIVHFFTRTSHFGIFQQDHKRIICAFDYHLLLVITPHQPNSKTASLEHPVKCVACEEDEFYCRYCNEISYKNDFSHEREIARGMVSEITSKKCYKFCA